MSRQMLAHYEILAPLGRGGMGEVYRARDTHLEREVALKVLKGELASDEALLARFSREAKLLAAVNHPNIAGIYSIERSAGKLFLVLELVDGESLSKRLDAGPLPLVEALDINRQIADALAAAHSRHVIHRDLKPANVMVTLDGVVKLLDFGVAKTMAGKRPDAEAEPRTVGADDLTSTGLILGTAPYMSPEQVRGKRIDTRSDIWSFGCVFFETLTGRRAFARKTPGDTLAAIIEGDVDWDALPGATPPAILRVLRRCLQPDPRQRLHEITDARLDIEETSQLLSGAITAPTRGVPAGRHTWALGGALVALVTVAFLLWAGGWLAPAPNAPGGIAAGGAAARALPLTSLAGSEIEPSLSPDGRFVAYAWDGGDAGDHFDLYVQQVGSGQPLRLTEGTSDVREPAWSPDGREIVFLRLFEGGWGVESVPPLGGAVRRLGSVFGVAFPGLDYSPDGERLAVVHRSGPDTGESIFLVDRRTGEKVRLSEPPQAGVGDRQPAFSPDGESLAFVRWYESPLNEIYVSDLSGNIELLVAHDAYIEGIAWLPDGSGLVFSSALGGASSLWHVDRDGNQQPLAFGDSARGVTIVDGTLVYSRRQQDTNLWVVGGPAAPEVTPPRRLIAATRDDWAPSFSPDGSRIAFMSHRSGDARVWICDSDGESCAQLDIDGLASTPRWSPDGSQIAFGSSAGGSTDISVVGIAGGTPRQIVSGGATNLATGWSTDGRWLYLTSDRTGEYQVWKAEVETGDLVRLTQGGGVLPRGSADGRFVYYLREGELFSIWKVPVDGGEERLVFEHPGLTMSGFSVWDGNLVYFLREPGTPISIHTFDPETADTRELFRFDASVRLGRYGRLTVSPDGRWIVYPQEDGRGGDLMVVNGFGESDRR